MPRWAKRADGNQAEIVAALRKAGYQVLDFHQAGFGVPDLLVCAKVDYGDTLARWSCWVEVKKPGELLTQAERQFFDKAPGQKIIVYDAAGAVSKLQMARAVRE